MDRSDVAVIDGEKLGVIAARIANVLQHQEWITGKEEIVAERGVIFGDGLEQVLRTFVEIAAGGWRLASVQRVDRRRRRGGSGSEGCGSSRGSGGRCGRDDR